MEDRYQAVQFPESRFWVVLDLETGEVVPDPDGGPNIHVDPQTAYDRADDLNYSASEPLCDCCKEA